MRAALFVLAVFACGKYADNRQPNFSQKAELYVYPGMSPEDVLAAIPDSVVLRPASLARAFRKEFKESLSDTSAIRPGHYVIESSKPSVYVPRMLKPAGRPRSIWCCREPAAEGEIARKISRQLMLDSAVVVRTLNDDAALAAYGCSSRMSFRCLCRTRTRCTGLLR